MTTILIIIFYLVGVVLAYGRAYAHTFDGYISDRIFACLMATLSWFGFAAGVVAFFICPAPFLRFRAPKELPEIIIKGISFPVPQYDFENKPPKAYSWRS